MHFSYLLLCYLRLLSTDCFGAFCAKQWPPDPHMQARRYIYLQRGLGWASWLKAVKLQPFSGWAWPGDAKASNWAASVIYSCQAVHHHHRPGTSPIPMPISQSSGSGRVLSRPLLWFIYATPSWADSHVALTLH